MRKHWVQTDRLVEQEVLPVFRQALTAEVKKFEIYTLESTFRQGWFDLLESGTIGWLKKHTYLLLKPDSFVSRKYGIVFDFLKRQGFQPLGFFPFRNSRNTVSEMWRYQWNSVPVDRSMASTKLNSIADSVVLVLKDCTDSSLPASVRLTTLKGNAQRFLRKPETLRWVLDCVNPMICYIHTPDEPIDVLREISIIFPSEERRKIFSTKSTESWESIGSQSHAIASMVCEHDLNFENSRDRLVVRSQDPYEMRSYIDHCYDNLGMSWHRLLKMAGVGSEKEVGWDEIVVAAYCIFQNYDIPGIVENPGVERWLMPSSEEL